MNGAGAHPALDALGPGTTLVTANRRLARALHALHAQGARAAGERVWETADILPWQAWLRREWDAFVLATALAGIDPPGLVLDAVQEHALWRGIIVASRDGEHLLQPDATARLAREARALQHAWRLELPDTGPLPRDARAFRAWSGTFERRCRESGWIEPARVPDLLAEAWRAGSLPAPGCVVLAGFDELTPQQRDLVSVLESGGTRIVIAATPEARESRAVRRECKDPDAEMLAAALWARQRLETRADARIGIVVPDLGACRTRLARILEDVLAPGAGVRDRAEAPLPFNLSLGPALAGVPVVHAALTALATLREDSIPLTAVGVLLRSPFFAGGETEMAARARLDARLRARQAGRVTLETLLDEARAAGGCPLLVEALGRWRRRRQALPARCPPSAWTERFMQLLEAIGWPGERPLDSAEYQAVEAWRTLVSGLARLDAVTPSVDLREALGCVERVSGEQVFQPEGEAAPIEVLGVLEASGMVFDHLWVMGLHDEVWPQAPDPNPFLPLALQRAHGLPRSTPGRELDVARRITARLASAAPNVCFSHPGADGDRPLRPSPLIAALPSAEASQGEEAGLRPYSAILQAAGRLETLDDDVAPALTLDPVTGGARLFKLQAECPFRAFAELRLHARALEEPIAGPDDRARGTLLHRALELFWHEVGTSAALAALDGAALDALIDRVAMQAVDEAHAKRPAHYPPRYCAVERRRIGERLRAWIVEEGRRAAPFAVVALEQEHEVRLGDIAVRVRIDRIDRLDDGRLVLIDYKSGNVRLDAWFGDRPTEPQLPLYGVAIEGRSEAILFASLKPGSLRYEGVSAGDGFIAGKSRRVRPLAESGQVPAETTWEGQLEAWRRVLETLARDFRSGAAAVDPKDYPSTCRYCDLTPLCRVTEAAGFAAVDFAEDDAP